MAASKEQERERQRLVQSADMPTKDEAHIQSAKDSYIINEEVGKGSFGAVYRVQRVSDEKHFAMKCESVHVKKQILAHEAKVLASLNLLKSVHFVEMIDRGKVTDRFLFVVIRLVGKNLWDIRTKDLPDRRFTLNTSLKIAEQTLAGIRDLHRVGFLHRDIKPPNFAVGRECDGTPTWHTVYVLDFGLCRKVCSKGTDLRTPRSHCAFRGTTRYASLAAHDGNEQSRRDDLEAWWYMTVEMVVYEIPWKSAKATERDKVRDAKRKLRTEEGAMKALFKSGGPLEQFQAILQYLDGLAYYSIPDYDHIYSQILSACQAHGIGDKQPVDWDRDHEFIGPHYKKGEEYIVPQLVES